MAKPFSVRRQRGTIGIAVNTDICKGSLVSWAIAFDPPDALKGNRRRTRPMRSCFWITTWP